MDQKNSSAKESNATIVYTGSGMNHRTFAEDESWDSLQSTILAGYLSTMEEDSLEPAAKGSNLTAVTEEEEMDENEGEDLLNRNIDAISDEEVFFDCPNGSPVRPKTPVKQLQCARRPATPGVCLVPPPSSSISQHVEPEVHSGLDEERTGALLVQDIDEYNDLKDHAQSTPKLTSDSGFTASPDILSHTPYDETSLRQHRARRRPIPTFSQIPVMRGSNVLFRKQTNNNDYSVEPNATTSSSSSYTRYSPAAHASDRANKENLYRGNHSSAAKVTAYKSAKSPKKPARSVAQMKEFFENRNKLQQQSSIRASKTAAAARQLETAPRRTTKSMHHARCVSPSFRTKESAKLVRAAKSLKVSIRSSNNNNNTPASYSSSGVTQQRQQQQQQSFVIRRNRSSSRSSRPSSCSDFPTSASSGGGYTATLSEEAESSASSALNKSRSMGDLTNELQVEELMYAVQLKRVTTRRGNGKTPKNKAQKTSSIMKRKSFGFVSSPVKPVKELRKLFSPSMTAAQNGINRSRKSRGQTVTRLPHIVITQE